MAKRPVILGLDPAIRRTGWACCDLRTGTPILCESLDLASARRRDTLEWVIYDALLGVEAVLHRTGLSVALIYAEKHFVGLNRAATINLAEALGIHLMAATLIWEAPINRFRPSEWKNHIGLKGNASKAEAVAWALRQGWQARDDDSGEAGCIASAGWNFNQKGKYD